MPENTSHTELPSLSTVLEMELVQRRLAAVEAQVKELDASLETVGPGSAGVLASRFLAGMSGVAAAALVVIAASMVWQAAHPQSPARPVVVMQAPVPGDSSTQTQPFRQPAHQPGMTHIPTLRPSPRG